MTKEEALDVLIYLTNCEDVNTRHKEAIEIAIEALEPQPYDSPTNGSIFLKTYPDSHVSNIAYDNGVCYVYVDLGGSRIRFTSDWWNASYKADKE